MTPPFWALVRLVVSSPSIIISSVSTRRVRRWPRHLAAFCAGILLSGAVQPAAPGHAQIFWANQGTATIAGANLDGTGVVLDFIIGPSVPTGVAVNGTHIFWANLFSDTIGRANLDGSGAVQDFITGAAAPYGVAINGTHIFWGNFDGGTIGRADLDGMNPNQDFITGASGPTGLAINGTHIFWGNFSSSMIGRANLDGSGAVQDFITGAVGPYGVAINGTHIFWSNSGGGTIGRADLDGTNPNQDFITGAAGPFGVAINDNHIFWSNQNPDTIGRANLDGMNPNQDFITGANGTSYVALGPGALLPVELVSFEALVDGASVLLTWQTASETNNAGFEVLWRQGTTERRDDAAWQALAFVEGRGTTSVPQQYTYRAAALPPGRHTFRLKQIDYDGAFDYGPVVEATVELAERFVLAPAYPNPFNPQATVRFAVKEAVEVRAALYDVLGREVQVLYAGTPAAGEMIEVRIDGRGLVSGLYLVRLMGEGIAASQAVTLLK